MVYSGFLFGPTGGGWFVWFWLILNHTHPIILVIFEWWHNSIVVTTARFWLYFLFTTSYIMTLVLVSKYYFPFGDHIYYAMDF
jgi:hypothetical protein